MRYRKTFSRNGFQSARKINWKLKTKCKSESLQVQSKCFRIYRTGNSRRIVKVKVYKYRVHVSGYSENFTHRIFFQLNGFFLISSSIIFPSACIHKTAISDSSVSCFLFIFHFISYVHKYVTQIFLNPNLPYTGIGECKGLEEDIVVATVTPTPLNLKKILFRVNFY